MSSYRTLFLVVTLNILNKKALLTTAVKVNRTKEGDLFPNAKCQPSSDCLSLNARNQECLRKSCRKSLGSCEGLDCCFCRCKESDQRSTFVNNQNLCVGNSALPSKLGLFGEYCKTFISLLEFFLVGIWMNYIDFKAEYKITLGATLKYI